MAKVLTAFFSMTGETYANGGVVNLDKGYTQIAAEYINDAIGGGRMPYARSRQYRTAIPCWRENMKSCSPFWRRPFPHRAGAGIFV